MFYCVKVFSLLLEFAVAFSVSMSGGKVQGAPVLDVLDSSETCLGGGESGEQSQG